MKTLFGFIIAVLVAAMTLPAHAGDCNKVLTEVSSEYSAPPEARQYLGLYRGAIGAGNKPLFCGNINVKTIDSAGHIVGDYVVAPYGDSHKISVFTFEGLINANGEAFVVTTPKRLSFKFSIKGSAMDFSFFGKDRDTPGSLEREGGPP